MASSIQRTDSIDGAGYPLGFKVREARAARGAREVVKVELRALGGHQKECVVSEGEAGAAFRLTSDEGAGLHGTDLAPFPLGFMSAGLQADFIERFVAIARERRLAIDSLTTRLLNGYEFNGSFFRGDGKGSAAAPKLALVARTTATADAVREAALAALDASPVIAMCRAPLANTFALYVNSRRRAITVPTPSSAPDADDPYRTWSGAPAPLAGAAGLPDMISKVTQGPGLPPGTPVWGVSPDPNATVRRQIQVLGEARWDDGLVRAETWAGAPPGSRFGLVAETRSGASSAPSGSALAAAGIAFCLTTQLLRYIDVHKMNVRALRLAQFSPIESDGRRATPHPLDTHVFVHGTDTDERMEKLLQMAQNTCYLHALLAERFEPTIDVEVTR